MMVEPPIDLAIYSRWLLTNWLAARFASDFQAGFAVVWEQRVISREWVSTAAGDQRLALVACNGERRTDYSCNEHAIWLS